MEDWARIRYLHQSGGLSRRQIAKQLGISRDTVARALAASSPPKYKPRPAVDSRWSDLETAVRALLAEFPDMPATVIAERVGWQGSASWLRENVSRIRPEFRRVDPADRLVHLPGEQVQCDLWFPPVDVPLGHGPTGRPPVLVMVASYSRLIGAVMIPSRRTGDLLAGMVLLLADVIGAVPKRLLWDNEAGIGRGGRLAEGVAGFCGTLGTRLVQARPYDPETKGIVERANQYLETSFLPGRTFTSPADFNTQLADWLSSHGNRRRVRATGARPFEAIEADRAAMGPLPPVLPAVGERWTIRLGRDYYVRAGANDYSVSPALIDRLVEVHLGLDQVTVTHQGQVVAAHQRVWASGVVVTDPAHLTQAAALRHDYQHPVTTATMEDLGRDLRVYDAAFGIDPAALTGRVVA